MRTSATLDRERFSELFEAHYAQVQAFAVRRVGRDLADEVTAETFPVAWRRLDAVPAQPLPWLYGVACNMIARELAASAKQAKAARLIAQERLGPALEDDCEHESLWVRLVWRDAKALDRGRFGR